jgi:hypothetical protein
MLIMSGIEKIGQQITNDPGAMAAETSRAPNETDNETGSVDIQTLGQGNTLERASGRARNVDNVQSPIRGMDVRGIGGAKIHPQPSIHTTAEYILCLVAGSRHQLIASEYDNSHRSLPHFYTFFDWRALICSQ